VQHRLVSHSWWAVLGLTLAACRDPDPTPGWGSPPTVLDPTGETRLWLAKRVSLQTDEPTTLQLVLSGPGGERTISFPERRTTHDQPLLGLHASESYTLTVRVTGEGGVTESDPIEFVTEPLPSPFPELELLVSAPERMEPGYTLLPLATDGVGYLAALDAEGQPVWLASVPPSLKSATQTPDAGYISIADREIRKIDALGNTVKRFVAEPTFPHDVPLGGFTDPHHEVFELPDGRVFAFVLQSTHEQAYPQSYADLTQVGPADLQDDVIVELSPEGVALGQWALSQFVPTTRIGYNSLEIERDTHLYDWAHGNSIDYDEDEDALTVSMRHQDAVLRFSRATGELQWILGHPFGWGDRDPYVLTAVRDFLWHTHQHAAMAVDSGRRILLFDNGNHEHATPHYASPQPGEFSRMVEYTVDPDALTVDQTWTFGAPSGGTLYSGLLGNADELPTTGNLLGTWGSLSQDSLGKNTEAGRGARSLRVVEVDRLSSEIVWELSVWSDATELAAGWSSDRATRIPSLYPPGVREE
jgi:arylsulfate sulfotransferase